LDAKLPAAERDAMTITTEEAAIAELHSMLEDVAHDVLREGYLEKKTISAEMIRFAKRMVKKVKNND
jgi:hypothetical protein